MAFKKIRFTRLGRHTGKEDLEPSCGVMDIFNESDSLALRFVVDCGIGQVVSESEVDQAILPDLAALDDGKQIDAVVLTHAHADHYGALTMLPKRLAPGARIYGTSTTNKVMKVLLDYESAHVADGHKPIKPYTLNDVGETLRRFTPITREGETQILGIPVLVHGAGHINGACSFTFKIEGKNILYTGDVCTNDQVTLKGAVPVPAAWREHVIAGNDCTYGATFGAETDYWTEMEKLLDLCYQRAVLERRRVVIMTFAYHRAANIAQALCDRRIVGQVPVYLDGMAASYAEMYARGDHMWRDRGGRKVRLDGVTFIEGSFEREAYAESRNPYIAIVPPGMGGPCEEGSAGDTWRTAVLSDPRATLVGTGYASPDSDFTKTMAAFELRERTGEDQIMAYRLKDRDTGNWKSWHQLLACDVKRFRLGSHDGRRQTIARNRQSPAGVIVLSHGSVDALANMEKELSDLPGERIRADLRPSFEYIL